MYFYFKIYKFRSVLSSPYEMIIKVTRLRRDGNAENNDATLVSGGLDDTTSYTSLRD